MSASASPSPLFGLPSSTFSASVTATTTTSTTPASCLESFLNLTDTSDPPITNTQLDEQKDSDAPEAHNDDDRFIRTAADFLTTFFPELVAADGTPESRMPLERFIKCALYEARRLVSEQDVHAVTYAALYLLHRLHTTRRQSGAKDPIPAVEVKSPHALFVAAYMLASKSLYDCYTPSTLWDAISSGTFGVVALNRAEIALFDALEFEVGFCTGRLDAFRREVKAWARAGEQVECGEVPMDGRGRAVPFELEDGEQDGAIAGDDDSPLLGRRDIFACDLDPSFFSEEDDDGLDDSDSDDSSYDSDDSSWATTGCDEPFSVRSGGFHIGCFQA